MNSLASFRVSTRRLTLGVGPHEGDDMPSITLAVTTAVINQVNEGNEYQRQLAIRGASPDLRALIRTASAQNRVPVAVCGVFELAVGDTDAIWEVHQAPGFQCGDFSNLYSLLARRPEVSVTFQW